MSDPKPPRPDFGAGNIAPGLTLRKLEYIYEHSESGVRAVVEAVLDAVYGPAPPK